MPKDFDMCRANGGKIRTKKMGMGSYAHICIDSSGKSHMGEIKKYQKVTKPKSKK